MIEEHSRYIIGIDLGTTNTSVAYVDTNTSKNPSLTVRSFLIPQVIASGMTATCAALPSCCYFLSEEEINQGECALPWFKKTGIVRDYVVGQYALECGAKTPSRFVHSAKSWLCHSAAHRKEKILPFDAAREQWRISPVEATTRVLIHIKEAWNDVMGKGDPSCEFEQQEVILTVPASFDEVARALTVEAAKMAGFTKMTLLEEPQAAFYHWMMQHEGRWEQKLRAGHTVLVCDVGGGTTDFSLIVVENKEQGLTFQRMAVGRHLLLGGNNMDATLTFHLEERLRSCGALGKEQELDSNQWQQLGHEARRAKESLLSGEAESYTALLQGSGVSVVRGSMSALLCRDEVQQWLLKGFFGDYDFENAVALRTGSGIKMVGLPFEDEPSITKHLAAFLQRATPKGEDVVAPDYVLFNGGTMEPCLFQEAILRSLARWFPRKKITALESESLHLAVSRGAGYFGKVRRGLGVRIGGGTSRALYLSVDVKGKDGAIERRALTLLPRGCDEGTSFQPEETFHLTPNAPVVFNVLSSQVRLDDQQGDLVRIEPDEMQSLPPIHTVLRFGKGNSSMETIPVKLEARLTEIGTVELWLKAQCTSHQWLLEFQLRAASGEENTLTLVDEGRTDEIFDVSHLEQANNIIRGAWRGQRLVKPKELMVSLEKVLEVNRNQWPPSILRGLWDSVLEQASNSRVSSEHEARWWNLAGFLLRPGFGYPLDDFRIKALWKVILSRRRMPSTPECQLQQWICYRRIAGGLSKGQQIELASELMNTLFHKKTGRIEVKHKSDKSMYSEKVRTLAAMEHLDIARKKKLGQALMDRIIAGEGRECDYWALGRIGARHLIKGSLASVVPKDVCVRWIEELLRASTKYKKDQAFALMQLARKTDQREINLPKEIVDRVGSFLASCSDTQHLREHLNYNMSLSSEEQSFLLGDSLPAGLLLYT